MSAADLESVRSYLAGLQGRITAALEAEDGEARFEGETLEDAAGGTSRPRVLEGGPVLEKAAVNFTHSLGTSLPAAATERRPDLAGRAFQAVSLSLIVHPRNPYAPTSHANFRFFTATREDAASVWWFGGGFDLTPYYGFDEDCRHWHGVAREACEGYGENAYARYKTWCDEYFFLPHRNEARGIGGLFFDDLNEGGFDACFGFFRRVSHAYLDAYRPILARRKTTAYGKRERQFQLYRRGRYVEFNLLYDRGTKYGLQSGRRVESVLASMPPEVQWRYAYRPEPGTPEGTLVERYLIPRDWV